MLIKRGISAVVATVLMVMIVVAAVAIIWGVFIPMLRDNAATISDKNVQLEIVTTKGYTVYDSGKGFIQLQIKRGQDDLNLSGYQVVFYNGGSAHSVEIQESVFPDLIPEPGQAIVAGFELPENFGKPERIRIAPIVDGELQSVSSEVSIALGTGVKDAAGGILPEDIDVNKDGGPYALLDSDNLRGCAGAILGFEDAAAAGNDLDDVIILDGPDAGKHIDIESCSSVCDDVDGELPDAGFCCSVVDWDDECVYLGNRDPHQPDYNPKFEKDSP